MAQPREVEDPHGAARARSGTRYRLEALCCELRAGKVVQRKIAAHDVDPLGQLRIKRRDVATPQLDAVVEAFALEQSPTVLEHRLREIEPDHPDIGTAVC